MWVTYQCFSPRLSELRINVSYIVMNQPCNLCKKHIYFYFESTLQVHAPKAYSKCCSRQIFTIHRNLKRYSERNLESFEVKYLKELSDY